MHPISLQSKTHWRVALSEYCCDRVAERSKLWSQSIQRFDIALNANALHLSAWCTKLIFGWEYVSGDGTFRTTVSRLGVPEFFPSPLLHKWTWSRWKYTTSHDCTICTRLSFAYGGIPKTKRDTIRTWSSALSQTVSDFHWGFLYPVSFLTTSIYNVFIFTRKAPHNQELLHNATTMSQYWVACALASTISVLSDSWEKFCS